MSGGDGDVTCRRCEKKNKIRSSRRGGRPLLHMNQRSGHPWSLLNCERELSHLLVPVQGCKVSGRVSVGDGAPRPGEHHLSKAAGASEGQIITTLQA